MHAVLHSTLGGVPRSICVAAATLLGLVACADGSDDQGRVSPWACAIPAGEAPDSSDSIGCRTDFDALASAPLDASIPGARSVKTIGDQFDEGRLYFQNSQRYPMHWEFARAHLSGVGRPTVPELGRFNDTEYYSPSRRFLLGAVTLYESSQSWVYEIAPYDTAGPELITQSYQAIAAASFFGAELFFHPTSQAVARVANDLPASVRIITTEELFAEVDYQPLNLAQSLGRLRFMTAAQLESEYVGFRDIVVLDHVPNDISVVMGIITAEFQTPLSHINVLSQNRGTPNMALRGASDHPGLRALDGKWVRLDVNAFDYEIEEVTVAEADAWWEGARPAAVRIPQMDRETADLRDIEDVCDLQLGMGDCLDQAIPAFGGKASHYSVIAQVGDPLPAPKAFGVPVHHYVRFMEDNGFDQQVHALLADEDFLGDPAVRDAALGTLRDAMKAAPLDPEFEASVLAKLAQDYPGVRMRFRSSTNAEDLDGFTGAGLYTSKSGDPADLDRPVADAIRKVWASIWFFRAFEERSYRSIDHQGVGMALLVHRSFPDEEANGVALTANPYDTSGLEPGFYVNVQAGEASVVKPEPGVTTDQFVYQFDYPGQPITFIAHSNQVPEGENVLTVAQTYRLGQALKAVHETFRPLYGQGGGWYAMDVEFKFDGEPGEEPALFVKQARPHPGWGN